MKFICICNYGHSRSVAMCRVLHERNHEAIPVGYDTSYDAAMTLMSMCWPDHVIFMTKELAQKAPIPIGSRRKIEINDVGPDIWSNPYNQDLLKLCAKFADSKGW